MVNWLRRIFIKDYQNVTKQSVRDAHGKLACFVGIISNLLLFGLKMGIGLVTGSVAIVGDSINNLSDMGSSIITLIGFKVSSMPADKEHPYGHERMEYIAGLIVSIVILVVGFQLGMDSIEAIINNKTMMISEIALIILGISIVIKLWQGFFYKKMGKTIDSVALEATAQDSINDVVSTSVILIGSLVIYFVPNIPFSLDGVLGIFVAIFILVAGIKTLKETISPLIGINPKHEYIQKIVSEIKKEEVVLGVHDIRCHMYGPTKAFMTLHVEVDGNRKMTDVHDKIDNIEKRISEEFNIELTIHMDPIETKDEYTLKLKEELGGLVKELGLSFHDFRVVRGDTHNNVIFDLIVPQKYQYSNQEIQRMIEDRFSEYEPKLYFVITFDGDYLA